MCSVRVLTNMRKNYIAQKDTEKEKNKYVQEGLIPGVETVYSVTVVLFVFHPSISGHTSLYTGHSRIPTSPHILPCTVIRWNHNLVFGNNKMRTKQKKPNSPKSH